MIRSIAFGLTVACGTVVGVWLADRSPTFETVEAAVDQPVRPGETMYVRYRVNRFRQCEREVYREIIDGEDVKHSLGQQGGPTLGSLGSDTYVQQVRVPPTVSPGAGQYRVTIQDKCNPIHAIWPLTSRRSIEIMIAEPS